MMQKMEALCEELIGEKMERGGWRMEGGGGKGERMAGHLAADGASFIF